MKIAHRLFLIPSAPMNPLSRGSRVGRPRGSFGGLGAAILMGTMVIVTSTRADGPFRNSDSKDNNDAAEGTYPVPYHLPTRMEITSALTRVRDYLETAAPAAVVDGAGKPITDFSALVAEAMAARGEEDAFNPLDYTMGVVHAGMLLAAEVTGDKHFAEFTAKRLQFIADRTPYFRAQAEKFGVQKSSFRAVLRPAALDDSGSMCAALIRARRAGVGPDLMPQIQIWSEYIAHRQFRLPDGTLARQRPQAVSLWADDFYMSVPALAQMGALTGDRAWFDDAVKNVAQMSSRLFNPALNLYTHGWNANNPSAPQFYWGRANGWAVLAICDLLDVLPADHPGREAVVAQLRLVLRGVAQYQSGTGLWHQMLDRNDSYLETSASAIFVYGLAHAINQGWISPVTYGSIAQAGWIGVSTRINAKGQVEGSCVGTTFASDEIYYYNRPASVYATHGYGPVLLAGAEMIKLLENPAIDIQHKLRTYHYVPKAGTGASR
jgi:unsaturated rhamnogalacturonyl hydrolase